MDLKDLYQEIILDHAKNPRNRGKCEGYNHDAKAHNPLCGDKVHIYLKLDEEKNISGLSFEGGGMRNIFSVGFNLNRYTQRET